MSSPLKVKHTEKSALSESMHLNDSLSQELQPIVYTPENCRKPFQNPSPVALIKPSSHTAGFQDISSNRNSDNSLKLLCEEEILNSTFTICEDTRSLKSKLPEQEPQPNNNKNILQRLDPSFSTKHSMPLPSVVPSYMAMTAAAKRKRKLTSIPSAAEENHGFAKRVRSDNSSDKHLQEHRTTTEFKRNIHKINPRIVRKFGRNISKGNLR